MADDFPPGTPGSSQRPCARHDKVVDLGGRPVAGGPCLDREGRPVLHPEYVRPRGRHGLSRWSALSATLLAVLLPALFFVGRPGTDSAGLRRALSPGPTSSVHSLATFDCVQCHRESKRAEDVRCERCHDPSISARLSNAAHVFQGTGDLQRGLAAPAVACTSCHIEHRGEAFRVADVDGRECGTCHRSTPGGWTRLSRLADHPEFAVVRTAIETGSGLRWFNHKLHLTKVAKEFNRSCDRCHESTADQVRFAPISFDRHCATCHEPDLGERTAGSLPVATVQAFGAMPKRLGLNSDPNDDSKRIITGLRHADPWLLRTVYALEAVWDPARAAAERLLLDRQAAQLELMLTYGLPGGAHAWSNAMPPTATRSPQPPAPAAFETETVRLRALAQSLGLDTASVVAGPPAAAPTPPAPMVAADSTIRLIDATIARAEAAGDQRLLQRARALRARAAKFEAGRSTAANGAAIAGVVDAVVRQLGPGTDPGTRAGLRDTAYLADLGRQLATGGIDPTAFDLHRKRLLELLAATDQALTERGTRAPLGADADGVLARTDALRRRILSNYFGLPPDLAAARNAFFSARQTARAEVDGELDAAGIRMPGPAEPADPAAAAWTVRLAQLRRRLEGARQPASSTLSMPAPAARASILALIGEEAATAEDNASAKNRCTLCHEVTADGTRLAPMGSPARGLFINSTFDHKPHLTAEGRNCSSSCHSGIAGSVAARDVNVPGIDSCRSCHAPGRQAAGAIDCASCHTYHARSQSALMWQP